MSSPFAMFFNSNSCPGNDGPTTYFWRFSFNFSLNFNSNFKHFFQILIKFSFLKLNILLFSPACKTSSKIFNVSVLNFYIFSGNTFTSMPVCVCVRVCVWVWVCVSGCPSKFNSLNKDRKSDSRLFLCKHIFTSRPDLL